MERRRTTRSGADIAPVTRKLPSRRATILKKNSPSPVREASPVRKQSPARRQSPGRPAKTRAKSKSPARKASPERKKSPARKASPERKKSPARKAPVVKRQSPARAAKTRAKSKSPIPEPKTSQAKKGRPQKSAKATTVETVNPTVTGKLSPVAKTGTPDTSQHSLTTTERSRHTGSRSASAKNDFEEYSDQELEFQSFHDNGLAEKTYLRRATKQLNALQEYGGQIGALFLIISIPLFVFGINYFCSGPNRACYFKLPANLDEFKTLSMYINKQIGVIFLLFVSGITIGTAIPIGRSVKLDDDVRGQISYMFTGLSCAFFAGVAIFVTEYCYKYPVINIISKGYIQLLCISIVYALVTSALAYAKSKYVLQHNWNPYAKTNKFMVDFFIGREINPKTFNLINVKAVHYHISIIMALIFNGILLYKNLKFTPLPLAEEGAANLTILEKAIFTVENLKFDSVSVLASGLMVVYLLDLLIFEHHLTCSFELQNEGVGALLLLRYAVFPFTVTLLPKYVNANKLTEVPLWAIGLIATIFLIGLVVKRASNRLKYNYRMNPLGPKFLNLETLPTFQGRRLLVASWWSKVRQPNYSGDILQNISLLPLLYWRFAWPPLLAALFTVVLLVHRARRVSNRNAKKYNSSWQRYCTQVPYLLVPRVY